MLIEMARARQEMHMTQDFLRGLHAYPVSPTSKSMWKAGPEDLYHSDVGDQGVVFALFKKKPQWFSTLSQTWNSDHCHNYYGAFTKRISQPQGILHRNCIGAHIENVVDPASDFFNFFNKYPLHWHDGHFRTVYTEVKDETSVVGNLYSA
jgi:hypothetical protein